MSSYRRYDGERSNGGQSKHRHDNYQDYDRSMYDERPGSDHYDGYRPQNAAHSDDHSRNEPQSYRDPNYSDRRYDSPKDRSADHGRLDRRRSPPNNGHRGGYRDRDREGYRSPRSTSRSGSRSRSRSRRRSRSPRFGGPPSKDIMLDGLPPDMTEDDISTELKRSYGVDELENVRIIRDKQTRQPRGFGFIRFASLEAATHFVDRNSPTVSLYGGSPEDGDRQAMQVRIAYSRERDDRSRNEKSEGDWACRICNFMNFTGRKACFKCHSSIELSVGENTQKQEFTNTGDSDASPDGVPSQFLLIRGLEPSVTEELLAKGVAKMYKPTSSATDTSNKLAKKGNAKVASTTGDANLGAREGSLKRIMLVRDRQSNDSWRYGFAEFFSIEDAQAALTRFQSFERFTIASKPIEASYIHAGVFVPVFDPTGSPEGVTFAASTNSDVRLQYWDENAYVRELALNSVEEHALPPSSATAQNTTESAAAVVEQEGLVSAGDDAKIKKRKGESKDAIKPKKAAPAHLQFWSNRHAELHGLPQKAPESDLTAAEDEPASQDLPAQPDPPQSSYADPSRKCCLLCSRQFQTDSEVYKHERLSKLHSDNLQNSALIAKASAKLAKAGITPGNVPNEENAPEYRDRAKERRRAFGTAKRASLPLKKDPAAEVKKKTEEEEKEEEDRPPVQSKGASLLGKMGWAAGQGLGAQGTGMKAPIAADLYAAGVGLGAEGGRIGEAVEEAARSTKGDYRDFVEKAKEKAKERFEKMS